MMPRTITRNAPSLFVDTLGGVEFPQPRESKPESTVIFNIGTKQSTGLHWHEDKTGNLLPASSYTYMPSSTETCKQSSSK